jgi:hypothetical protein
MIHYGVYVHAEGETFCKAHIKVFCCNNMHGPTISAFNVVAYSSISQVNKRFVHTFQF